jgi:F-type H+-transporting ATPase subunit a
MHLIASAELPFTALLNRLFGGVVTALLQALGIHPHDPAHPIPNYIAMQVLVALVLIAWFAFLRTRLSVAQPGALQHVMESLYEFVENQSEGLIGHGYKRFTPFLMALGLYILLNNLLGLVPTLESPTANPSVPLGCALATFVYYNFQGIRANGLHYANQFIGPVWWLGILMVPIEIVSHLARVMSLTVRLYANIFAGDMVTLIFFSLVPVILPVPFYFLHLGVAFIQTFIFVLLTTVYLQLAVAEEH